ncbi:CCA tRNA nucleotidyltransferase [Candidatus Woesearchaeota archaeon]|nr:CCA tRNA nucleotidyltransferase [Candidatus Woesearchaeota archaeon]
MQEVLKQVLERIKPTRKEKREVKGMIDDFLEKLNKNLKNAKAILGGSGKKGTWLRGMFDIDLFVLYNYKRYKDKSSELPELLQPVMEKTFGKLERLHGSRDYFQIQQGSYTFEIVPILKIDDAEKAVNITDISPLHARWVLKHKQYQDDIRLLKQFCRANRVYGAESYIQGFSGYICEILAINYKGFRGVVKAASKWKKGEVIDVENHYRRKMEVFRELNQSKLVSPIIIIDPVQKSRNAAAALSDKKFEDFRKACGKFFRHPSAEAFRIREIHEDEIRKKAGKGKAVILKVTPLPGKTDIVGAKMMKAFDYMANQAERYGFRIKDKGWDWKEGKKALFWFITDKDIENEFRQEGPPVKAREHAARFRKKHKDIFQEEGRLYAKVKRDYTRLEDFMKHMARTDYVEEKTRKVEAV